MSITALIGIGMERIICQGRVWFKSSYFKMEQIAGDDADFTSDTPTPAATNLYLYAKNNGTYAAPYWKDSGGNEHQIGDAGVPTTITVKELDGSPTVSNVDTVIFNQGDGLTVTDNADGSVTVGLTGGSSSSNIDFLVAQVFS